jgi:uncharacterized protein
MRRHIVNLFSGLWLLLFAASLAQAADVQNRGALFRAEANGNTMYLFGTIHVGAPGFFPLEPRIEAAVANASVLALEVDAERDTAAVMAAMQQYGMVAPGSDAYGAMKPEARERLRRALKRVRMDESALAFKPWMVSTLLAVGEFVAQGFRPDLSVDGYLARSARAKNVKIEELESIGAQLALFDRLSPEAQHKMLEETVDAVENGKQDKEVRLMMAAWENADVAGLDRVLAVLEQEDTSSGRFFRDVILYERNIGMADKLVTMLAREKSSVAAVGVLHLLGKRGVPELLRAKGIRVERVY